MKFQKNEYPKKITDMKIQKNHVTFFWVDFLDFHVSNFSWIFIFLEFHNKGFLKALFLQSAFKKHMCILNALFFYWGYEDAGIFWMQPGIGCSF